jgi:formylglycine-generating enzyme required for sulfatase activity
VVNVTWNDAVAFCNWLSRKEGVHYRLPTEAEWEYCCRAGTSTRYQNGNDPDQLAEVARVLDPKGKLGFAHVHQMVLPPDGPFTAPVGSGKPNAWGLYDMHGNAWEWCADWYDEGYYARSPTKDPQGPRETGVRVRRGGAWNTYPLWARASFRNYNTQESRCVNLGFRVVREVKP